MSSMSIFSMIEVWAGRCPPPSCIGPQTIHWPRPGGTAALEKQCGKEDRDTPFLLPARQTSLTSAKTRQVDK